MNRRTIKSVVVSLIFALVLMGCGHEAIPVIELDYVESDWTVRDIYKSYNEAPDSVNLHSLLEACAGEEAELAGELTVYDSYDATRRSGDYEMSKMVSYLKGERNYAACQNNGSVHPTIHIIDEFPSFIDLEAGTPVNSVPSIHYTPEGIETDLIAPTDHGGNAIRIVEDTTFRLKPSLSSELKMVLGDKPIPGTTVLFSPVSVKGMTDVRFALGYSESLNQVYIVQAYPNGHYRAKPIKFFDEVTFEMNDVIFKQLQVKRLAENVVFDRDMTAPVYELSYMEKGHRLTEKLSFMFSQTHTPEPTRFSIEERNEGVRIHLHKVLFDGMRYPDTLPAAGIDFDDLLEAIKTARPVKRSGDVGVYRFLTINRGLKGQVFDVTFKQRSKKLDIYLTDTKREQTFKLTSEGAETFLSYFPELKKD